MIKKILVCLLLINSSIVFSQNDSVSNGYRFSLTYSVSFYNYDFGGINSTLSANGLPQLSNNGFSGSGGFTMGNRTDKVFSTIFGGSIRQKNDNDLYETKFETYQINGDINVNVFNTESIYIHPFIGFFAYTHRLYIYEKAAVSSNFNTSIANRSGMISFDSNDKFNWGGNLGVGVDFVPKRFVKNLIFGVDLGYRHTFKEAGQYVSGKLQESSPKINMNGAYAALNITMILGRP